MANNGNLPVASQLGVSNTPSSTVVSNEKLDDIRNGGNVFSGIVNKAIDDATQHIVSDLDKLVDEIEMMKSRVIENGGRAKAGILEHFNLGAEATTFAEKIRTKLTDIIEDAETIQQR